MRVLKFGGKSLATTEQIDRIAKKLSEISEPFLVVVSAMGQSTSELLNLSSSLNPNLTDRQASRELDMLLGAGERVSAALFSLALQKYGKASQSFTGSQAGILTTGPHNDASIKEIKAFRVDEALEKGITPVVAGFQGVDPQTKDITTLGRGGSDLTATAFANYYKCQAELYKSVGGVFNCDPNLSEKASIFESLSYDFMEKISAWGAKVLHDKAATYAINHSIPIGFYSDTDFQLKTSLVATAEQNLFCVGVLDDVLALQVTNQNIPSALEFLKSHFKNLNFKVLASAIDNGDSRFLIKTDLKSKAEFLKTDEVQILSDALCCVSLLFSNSQEEERLNHIVQSLGGFEVKRLLMTDKRLSFFIDKDKKKELVNKLLL